MKQLIKTYSYNKTAKTVTLTDFTTVKLERLYLIIDSTLNVLMYNMVDSTVSPATVATNVITLTNVPASSANSDSLQIIYDCETGDPTYDTPPLALNAALETGGNLATIAGKDFATATHQTDGNQKTQVTNFPATQPVSGTFWQTTQPVSLATAPTTPVTGTFFQTTQPVSLATAPTTPVTGTFWQATQPISNATLTNIAGTWAYYAGTSGTVTVSAGQRVLQITAIAQQASATMTINGGQTITLPYGSTDKVSSAIEIKPVGNLVAPTIVFTGTVGYFVEVVS